MPKKIYVVTLSVEERSYLRSLISKGKVSAHKRLHAQILLKADSGSHGESWTDEKISRAYDVSRATVERVRQRCVEEGLEAALNRKKQLSRKAKKFDGEAEAHLIATACSKAPGGRSRWTLKLLGDKMVELGFVESVCNETVRKTLKKTASSHG